MAITGEIVHKVLHNNLRIPTREADFLINTAHDDGKCSGVPNETSPLFGALVTIHHAGDSLFTIEIH